jgi:hypothetical protein
MQQTRRRGLAKPDERHLLDDYNVTHLHSPCIWRRTSTRCRDQMQGASLVMRTAVVTSSQNVDAWTHEGDPLYSGACSLKSQGVWALVTAQVVVDPAPLVHCTATCQPVLDAAMLCRTWFESSRFSRIISISAVEGIGLYCFGCYNPRIVVMHMPTALHSICSCGTHTQRSPCTHQPGATDDITTRKSRETDTGVLYSFFSRLSSSPGA